MDQRPIALKPKQTKHTPNILNKLSTFFIMKTMIVKQVKMQSCLIVKPAQNIMWIPSGVRASTMVDSNQCVLSLILIQLTPCLPCPPQQGCRMMRTWPHRLVRNFNFSIPSEWLNSVCSFSLFLHKCDL